MLLGKEKTASYTFVQSQASNSFAQRRIRNIVQRIRQVANLLFCYMQFKPNPLLSGYRLYLLLHRHVSAWVPILIMQIC